MIDPKDKRTDITEDVKKAYAAPLTFSHEKAREMFQQCCGFDPIDVESDQKLLEWLAAVLEAERKAAIAEIWLSSPMVTEDMYEKGVEKADADGYRRGLEDAAKVAESYLMIGAAMNPQFPQLAKNLADQISHLKDKPEGGGGGR